MPDPIRDNDAVAMEFVLGVLDRETRQAAQLRLARDALFRAEVENWQALLSPLAEGIVSVSPPTAIWGRIVADIAPAAKRCPATPAAASSLWSSLEVWRGLAGAGLALAAVVSVILIGHSGRSTQPLLVATLSSPSGGATLTAACDATRSAVVLAPAGKSDTDGRTPELWAIEATSRRSRSAPSTLARLQATPFTWSARKV